MLQNIFNDEYIFPIVVVYVSSEETPERVGTDIFVSKIDCHLSQGFVDGISLHWEYLSSRANSSFKAINIQMLF